MKTIQIYGASDDLIEVDGPPGLRDEWSAYTEDPRFVELSTGDVFRVQYGDRGVWSVDVHVRSRVSVVRIDRAPPGDDPDPYTDTAHVTGPIEWVEVWDSWPPNAMEMADKIGDFADDRGDLFALGTEALRKIYALIRRRA